MKTNFEMVKEFHERFKHPIGEKPEIPKNGQLLNMRSGLIEEEKTELDEAIKDEDVVSAADALADLLYVVYGFGIVLGIDLDRVFSEVHRSNMSKLGPDGNPIYREDGKVLKGPNYTPPNISKVLYE